jgi:hypothetical protein
VANKNFGGWDGYLAGTNFVGSNYLLYINFDTSVYQISAQGTTNYAQVNPLKTNQTYTSGTIASVNPGPINGSYQIDTSVSNGNTVGTQTFIVMPVNGGNTLLMQGGTTGTADSTPLTGVCNKV